jgi:uncharacterized protein YvpB
MIRKVFYSIIFVGSFALFSNSIGEILPTSAQGYINSTTQSQKKSEEIYNYNFPLVFFEDDPPAGITKYCHTESLSIPDNDVGGISDTIVVTDRGFIADMDIRLDINHSWVGDLDISLTKKGTGVSVTLIDRPGYSPGGNQFGCDKANIKTILDDDVTWGVENVCSSYPAAISPRNYIQTAIAGTYLPMQPLATFEPLPVAGEWTLSISDVSSGNSGNLNQWCLITHLTPDPIASPEPPTPIPPPDQALISGVTGATQGLKLDCESRSAVDWANYFGVSINEYTFFYGLPISDNPDLGFVGAVDGQWGQLPPHPYGVHAEPIAKRLRKFGLPAAAHRPLRWDALKAEIAAGRPVIVWILGSKAYGDYDYVVNGIPEYYQPNEGDLTVVSRFEHTVVVTGYSPTSVTFLNGGRIEQRSVKEFLESWSALGNMAVTYQP